MKNLTLFLLLLITYLPSFSVIPRSGKSVFITTIERNEVYTKDSTKTENQGLWLLTAKVTESYTSQQDTLITFMAGNKKWDKEKHRTIKTVSSGEFTAVIENMAVDPVNQFQFDGDPNEPKIITVSGGGSHSESSKYLETIDGTMISADNRDINVSGSAAGAGIQFYYSNDYKSIGISININGVGSDKGRQFYDEWKDYGGNIDHYNIPCSAGCDLSTDKNCTITKTATGYQASWKTSENKEIHTVDGHEFITKESSMEVTISPYKESDKPVVTLYGCSELGTEEKSNVIATGKPEGGKFRFWVEPENLLSVQADGESSANLSGSTPGKGTLYVEYTSTEGKTNQTSQPASCVKIENYNDGQEIPQIVFYDIYGNKLSGILKIPVSAQPSNIEELVDYVAADQSVLSAVGQSGAVELTGSRIGKTTFQAKTNCGNITGPTVEVEIVNCDKETVEALEKMREKGMENLKEANERLQKVANSEEFEKARDEIVESTVELLAKSALTIIGSGETHGVVETAVEIAEAGESVSEMIASATKGEFAERTAMATLKAMTTGATKAFVGVMGVHEAAKKFANNLGQIILHESELKDVMKSFEKAYKDLDQIIRIQEKCKGEKTEPQKQDVPKTEPTPNPTEPTTKTETPPVQDPTTSTQTPPIKDPTTDERTTKEPTTEEPPISPPSPTSPPRQVGLPYSPASECGCNSSQGIGVSGKGFSALQTGMENLGKCVDSFSKGPLTNYMITLNDWKAVTDSLIEAVTTGEEGFKVAAAKAAPRINGLIGQTKSYDQAGKTFSEEFKACPESMKAGLEVTNSAKTVTIDSVKTKY